MGWRFFLGVVAYFAFLALLYLSISTFGRTHHDTFMAMYPTLILVLGKMAKATLLGGILLIVHVVRKVRSGQWFFAHSAARGGDVVPSPMELESGHALNVNGTEAPGARAALPPPSPSPIPTGTGAVEPAAPLPDPSNTLTFSIYTFISFILFLFLMGGYLMVQLDIISFKDKSFLENVQSFAWAMLEGLEVLFVGMGVIYVGMLMRVILVRQRRP